MIRLSHELPAYGIKVFLDKEDVNHNHISSYLGEGCPCCNQSDCFFDCDGSQMPDSPESEDEARIRIEKNRAYDGIESLILAHACAGIDIESPAYLEGIETAVEAVENNLS